MKKQPLFEMSVTSLVSDTHHVAPPANLPALTLENIAVALKLPNRGRSECKRFRDNLTWTQGICGRWLPARA